MSEFFVFLFKSFDLLVWSAVFEELSAVLKQAVAPVVILGLRDLVPRTQLR